MQNSQLKFLKFDKFNHYKQNEEENVASNVNIVLCQNDDDSDSVRENLVVHCM